MGSAATAPLQIPDCDCRQIPGRAQSAKHGIKSDTRYDIDDLADRYFTTKTVRRKVEAILRSFGITAANIDAEAVRCSISDLAGIDRRLGELALRHDKILQRLEDNRAGLATPTQLEQGGNGDFWAQVEDINRGERTADRGQP